MPSDKSSPEAFARLEAVEKDDGATLLPVHLARAKRYHKQNTDTALMSAILQEMEYVRIANGYTYRDFALLLGTDPSAYYRAIAKRGHISLSPFLAFCYVFGYDIVSLDARLKAQSEDNYDVQREVGALTCSLTPTTLRAIRDMVNDYDAEPPRKRHRYAQAMDALLDAKKRGTMDAPDVEVLYNNNDENKT